MRHLIQAQKTFSPSRTAVAFLALNMYFSYRTCSSNCERAATLRGLCSVGQPRTDPSLILAAARVPSDRGAPHQIVTFNEEEKKKSQTERPPSPIAGNRSRRARGFATTGKRPLRRKRHFIISSKQCCEGIHLFACMAMHPRGRTSSQVEAAKNRGADRQAPASAAVQRGSAGSRCASFVATPAASCPRQADQL